MIFHHSMAQSATRPKHDTARACVGPQVRLLARRSAEINYRSVQDPSDSAGMAKLHRNASDFGHFTIIMWCQESPSHSIFELREAE